MTVVEVNGLKFEIELRDRFFIKIQGEYMLYFFFSFRRKFLIHVSIFQDNNGS